MVPGNFTLQRTIEYMKTEDFDARIRQRMSQLDPKWDEADWIRLQRKLHPRPKRVVWPWLLLLAVLALSGGLLSMKWKDNGSRLPQLSRSTEKPVALQRDAQPEAQLAPQPTSRFDTRDSAAGVGASMKGMQKIADRQPHSAVRPARRDADLEPSGTHQIATATLSQTGLGELAGTGKVDVLGFGSEGLPPPSQQPLVMDRLPPLEMSFPVPEKSLVPPTRVKSLRHSSGWSAGVSTLASGSHWSGGLAAEFRTNKNIVFRSGIQRQAYFDQSFANQAVFKDETDVGFNEIAKPRHSKTEEFSNIRISSTDWILPLELRYIYPFSSRAALFVSGGVHLTLKSQTVLTFDYLSYESQEFLRENGLDQESNSATLINHFAFGAGYQRRIMGVDVQLAGVLKSNNSNLPHLKKREFAAQLSVMYPF
jgi:hypothetical protein